MDEPKGKDRSEPLVSKSSPDPRRGGAGRRKGEAGGGGRARRGAPRAGGIPLGGGRLCIFMRRSFRFATQEGAAAAASPGGASLPPSLPARPRSAAGGGRRLRGGGSPGVGGCSLAAVLPPHLGATSASSLWTPGRFRRDNVNLWLGGPGAGGGRGCPGQAGWWRRAGGSPGGANGAGGSGGSAPASGRSLAASVRGIPSLAGLRKSRR